MKRTNIWLTIPQWKALKKLSAVTGAPSSELIRRAIDAFLKKKS